MTPFKTEIEEVGLEDDDEQGVPYGAEGVEPGSKRAAHGYTRWGPGKATTDVLLQNCNALPLDINCQKHEWFGGRRRVGQPGACMWQRADAHLVNCLRARVRLYKPRSRVISCSTLS